MIKTTNLIDSQITTKEPARDINDYLYLRYVELVNDSKIPVAGTKWNINLDKNLEKVYMFQSEIKSNGVSGVLKNGWCYVDIDNQKDANFVISALTQVGLKFWYRWTNKGVHIYFKNSQYLDGCPTGFMSAIGVKCDYKISDESHAVLDVIRYKGEDRPLITPWKLEEVDTFPVMFKPIKPWNNETDKSPIGLKDGDGRNDYLSKLIFILASQKIRKNNIVPIIKFINENLFAVPLPKYEIDTLLDDKAFNRIRVKLSRNPELKDINFDSEFNKGRTSKLATLQYLNQCAEHLISDLHIIKVGSGDSNTLYYYNDGRFDPNTEGIYLTGIERLEYYALKIFSPRVNSTDAKEICKIAYSKVETCINVAVNSDPLNLEAKYIAFNNGILNTNPISFTEGFTPEKIVFVKVPHNYVDLINLDPADYQESDSYIKLMQILNKWFDYNIELINTFLDMCGYIFNPDSKYQRYFMFIGDRNNGKSAAIDLIQNMVGYRNFSNLSVQDYDKPFRTFLLENKLLNVHDDMGNKFIEGGDTFKKAITENCILVEKKFESPYIIKPYAKNIFSMNEIPAMNDRTGAILRRTIPIPFNHDFSNDPERDYDIQYKLKDEEIIETLIGLSILHLNDLIYSKSGFKVPVIAESIISQMEFMNKPHLEFLEELNLENDVLGQQLSYIMQLYLNFCRNNGIKNNLGKGKLNEEIQKYFNVDYKVSRINKNTTRRVYIKKEIN